MSVEKAFAKFEKHIMEVSRKRLKEWCQELVSAAVNMRLNDFKAHNFTGNLLNSIVVCLYEQGEPVEAFYSSEDGRVKSAIMPKMTARPRPYSFYKTGDYEGNRSVYKAEVSTNGGWGIDDAKEFFASFRPDGNNLFDVVVAYTVEYSTWVQAKRNSTGFLEMKGYAEKTALNFLEIK